MGNWNEKKTPCFVKKIFLNIGVLCRKIGSYFYFCNQKRDLQKTLTLLRGTNTQNYGDLPF